MLDTGIIIEVNMLTMCFQGAGWERHQVLQYPYKNAVWGEKVSISSHMWFPTMWQFDMRRLRRAWATSF